MSYNCLSDLFGNCSQKSFGNAIWRSFLLCVSFRLTPPKRRHARAFTGYTRLYPALHRCRCIARHGVEAQLGLGRVFMHHIDELLKQQQVAWIRAYSCPDQDAIEPLLLELALNNCLGGFPKVSQTHLHAVPETSQFVLGGLE